MKSPYAQQPDSYSAKALESADAAHLPTRAAADRWADSGTMEAPRLVIRGESLNEEETPLDGESYILRRGLHGKPLAIAIPQPKADGEPLAAITDYLNTTFPFSPSPENLLWLFNQIVRLFGPEFAPMTERRGGLHGYKRSFQLGSSKALFAVGGQSGTGFISFPGEACALLKDWVAVVVFFGDILKGRITRWDGAVDVYDGLPSVDDAVTWYLEGRFNAGGAKPSCDQKGNWIEPDGTGRTFYVGKRKNGKMLRVYEKGKQLGAPKNPWVRWELELHNVDREIPWDVLLEPGKYVAGSYPRAMGWVQEVMSRIQTIKNDSKLSYAHLTKYHQIAYGKHINVMLKVEGTAEKVIEKLIQPGVPARLHYGDTPLLDGGDS